MPVVIDGKTYYKTADVCRMVGISTTTLYRWFRQDSRREARHRDKRGWRLFTEEEVQRLKKESSRITQVGEKRNEQRGF
jgi:predicted site-specific integrase-resolvase